MCLWDCWLAPSSLLHFLSSFFTFCPLVYGLGSRIQGLVLCPDFALCLSTLADVIYLPSLFDLLLYIFVCFCAFVYLLQMLVSIALFSAFLVCLFRAILTRTSFVHLLCFTCVVVFAVVPFCLRGKFV